MMKIAYKRASVRVEMDYLLKGSVLKGTVKGQCLEARTLFKVESDAPADQVRKLIRNAKQGCFAEGMIQAPVPLKSEIELNGEKIALE
jgi:hypothetical protein